MKDKLKVLKDILKITLILLQELKMFDYWESRTSACSFKRLTFLTNKKPSYSVTLQIKIYNFEGCLQLAWVSPQLLNVKVTLALGVY